MEDQRHRPSVTVRHRRQWIAIGVTAAIPIALISLGGHRGSHAARNLLIPGAGLYDHHLLAGLAVTTVAIAAVIAWLRFGAEWMILSVLIISMALSAAVPTHPDVAEPTGAALRGAHEFPLVILVIGALSAIGTTLARIPVVNRLRIPRSRAHDGLDSIGDLEPVDRCRAVAIALLAGSTSADQQRRFESAVIAPDVQRRARWVGLIARGRLGNDPFRRDHVHARTARRLLGLTDPDPAALAHDAHRSIAGVPASEPGWIRPLDATLAAMALEDSGEPDPARRWRVELATSFRLRRGHRPAWLWTPLGVAAGRAHDWEHLAVTALARSRGWIGDEDWPTLRRRALGAAARGVGTRADERSIAAARIWLAMVEDPAAARIVDRPTVSGDPLAVALDRYARAHRGSDAVISEAGARGSSGIRGASAS